MELVKIEELYRKEIKNYINNKDGQHFLTKLQKDEIYSTPADEVEIDYLAHQYALELIDCIDALKEKGLL